MRVLTLNASPRRDGNSAALAAAASRGATAAGHEVELVHLDDVVNGSLRDCRTCRRSDGTCSIDDGYEDLLMTRILPADGLLLATPLYWYGMSGQLKVTLDRLFCFMSPSYPASPRLLESLPGKRVGLLVSCEENYPGATLGIRAQVQEVCRYLRQHLVDVVVGVGNSRGEVVRDPTDPMGRAEALGHRLFETRVADYCFDTERGTSVWAPD